MRIAISGAGVAGPTLAWWLLRAGHQPTLIEASPAFRTGGYMIDFWGVGYDIAERMGLLPRLKALGYAIESVRFVDGAGREVGGFAADAIRRGLGGRFFSLPRGDLAAEIFRSVEGRIETIFGDQIVALDQQGDAVRVALERGSGRTFDLVVGADGLHSGVRALAFGDEAAFERQLGYYVAAFTAAGYRPREERAYVSHAVAGRQVSRIALRGGRTMFLLVFDAKRLAAGQAGARPALRQVFADVRWECPAILDLADDAADLYFDRVSQIRTPRWARGRVALIGDAASSPSLLAGEGAGLAMAQAYVLAGELALAEADPAVALAAYEARLRGLLDAKQRAARRFAGAFAPRTALGVWLRNRVTRLMRFPAVAERLLGADLRDDIDLPTYGWAAGAATPGAHDAMADRAAI